MSLSQNLIWSYTTGPPLDVGMDLRIASFDSISEVNMVCVQNSFEFVVYINNILIESNVLKIIIL